MPAAREKKDAFKATAYPNPFANSFLFTVATPYKSPLYIKVYTMLGSLVEERQVAITELETATFGESYHSGVYTVIVTHQDVMKTIRVVKR